MGGVESSSARHITATDSQVAGAAASLSLGAAGSAQSPGPLPDLQLIYDTAPIGLACLTPDCRYLQINRRMTEICGISVADHIGRSVRDMVPNLADHVEKIVQCILTTGEPVTGIEVTGQRADMIGADRCWLTSWYPMRDVNGRIVAVNIAAEEVTERKRAERQSQAALRASEERWKSVFQSSTLGISLTDQNLRFVATNAAFQQMVGYTDEELRKLSPLDLIVETEREAAQTRMIQLRQDKRHNYEVIAEYRRKDGASISVNTYVSTVPGTDASPPIFLATAIDVTARMQAEAKVRESEELFRIMAGTAPVLVWMSDTEMRCNFFNEVWLEFTGRTIEQELGSGWAEGVHPEDFRYCLDTFAESFKARRPFTMEYRLKRADGEYRWILDSGVPRFTRDGQFAGYIGSGIDITDRKKVESELRRSESYLAEAEKISHTGCWARNPNTGELFWSQEEWRIFCLEPEKTELSYSQFLKMIHPDDRVYLEETSAQAVREKRSYDIPFRIVLTDGSIKHIHSVGNPVLDGSGNVIEYIGVSQDVTEHKRAEAALQEAQSELSRVARLTTMGELAASIAHEIKQPLGAVVAFGYGCLRWLARNPPNLEEATLAAKGLITEAKRASDVIDRIRRLLKSDKPEYTSVDISDAIRDVLTLAHSTLQRRGVSVRCSLPSNLPPVLGDRVQLQQVIMNLIVNGADAMKSVINRPKVLRVGSNVDAAGSMLVVIEDSGTGVDPAVMDRIFDPLFTTKPEGMGMGLSICRSIVEAHGGRIWVTLGVPNGAVFQFTLPTCGQGTETLRE
jgi:PAS domain S-box-containing protein